MERGLLQIMIFILYTPNLKFPLQFLNSLFDEWNVAFLCHFNKLQCFWLILFNLLLISQVSNDCSYSFIQTGGQTCSQLNSKQMNTSLFQMTFYKKRIKICNITKIRKPNILPLFSLLNFKPYSSFLDLTLLRGS